MGSGVADLDITNMDISDYVEGFGNSNCTLLKKEVVVVRSTHEELIIAMTRNTRVNVF